jgi:hypothetical protein
LDIFLHFFTDTGAEIVSLIKAKRKDLKAAKVV